MPALKDQLSSVLSALEARAIESGVFASVSRSGLSLRCHAKGSAEPAEYRIDLIGDELYVSLVMEDRWQSQSIEAELVHSGDKLDELIEEEMIDLGYQGERLGFEHFRSDDMLFTFRSRLPIKAGTHPDELAEIAAYALLGYEICFRHLGDMNPGEDD